MSEARRQVECSVAERAAAASRVVLLRGFLVKGLSLATMLLLARYLGPQEFGMAALGLTVVALGILVADGGLGAALVRRPEPPTAAELSVLLGWQLLLAGTVLAGTAVFAHSRGTAGVVVVAMTATLPVMVLQTAGAVGLERELRYGPRVLVELVESVLYAAVAITLAVVGLGVWSIVWATVVRVVVGTAALLVLAPVRPGWPRLSRKGVGALVGFGAKVQAAGAVGLARDQGLNIVVAAVGGATALGVWNLATRLLQGAHILLEALSRVSFPALARMRESGGDREAAAAVRALVHAIGIVNGILVVGLVGGADVLVPWAFGPAWTEAGRIVPVAALGVLVSGPVGVAAGGYLFATGRPGVVLQATLAHTTVLGIVALALWPSLGVVALGWAWLVASAADALILGFQVRRWAGVPALSISCGYLLIGAVPMVMGALLSNRTGTPVGSVVSAGLFAGLVLMLRRRYVRTLWTWAAAA